MTGSRYELSPVNGCPSGRRSKVEVVCSDCGVCLAVHGACATDPGRVVGGGTNLLTSLDFGVMPEDDLVATFIRVGMGDFEHLRRWPAPADQGPRRKSADLFMRLAGAAARPPVARGRRAFPAT